MKKALVIGANSFLGKAIIRRLYPAMEVSGVYHQNAENLVPEINNIPVSQLAQLKDEYDVVFIISAYIPGKNESDEQAEKLLQQVNVDLPAQICAQFGKAKIIYASSVSVYGNFSGRADENTVCKPLSAYGSSKLAGENSVKKHPAYALIRISSMYGEGMRSSTFLPAVTDAALKEKRIRILGQGSRLQNYIAVEDVAEIFVRSALKFTNNTYLAVAENSTSNLQIAECIKSILPETEIIREGTDASPSFEYNGGSTFRELEYTPRKSIETGISELIEWKKRMF